MFEIAKFQFCYHNEKLIKMLRERGLQYKSDNATKLRKAQDNLEELNASSALNFNQPCKIIVTFNSLQGARLARKILEKTTVSVKMMLEGLPSVEVLEPSDIIWSNFSKSRIRYKCRYMCISLVNLQVEVLGLFWIISSYVSTYVIAFKNPLDMRECYVYQHFYRDQPDSLLQNVQSIADKHIGILNFQNYLEKNTIQCICQNKPLFPANVVGVACNLSIAQMVDVKMISTTVIALIPTILLVIMGMANNLLFWFVGFQSRSTLIWNQTRFGQVFGFVQLLALVWIIPFVLDIDIWSPVLVSAFAKLVFMTYTVVPVLKDIAFMLLAQCTKFREQKRLKKARRGFCA